MTIATEEYTTMASLPTLSDGIALTHFIVAEDVERAGRFYSDVLGGEIVLAGEPTIVALANSWIIINVGGGPTDDKPSVTLEPPRDPDRVSSFLNIRVADIQTTYQTWSERGAQFLTPPIDRGPETRCYLRDPEGHLISLRPQSLMVSAGCAPQALRSGGDEAGLVGDHDELDAVSRA